MKESYREGVASHSDPEPCEGGGNVALEALDRGICRLGMELRNAVFQDADGGGKSEGKTAGATEASTRPILRSRRPQACRETSCARSERPRNRPQAISGPEGERDER